MELWPAKKVVASLYQPIFTAPRQEFSTQGIKIQAEARTIMFHEDYIRGHEIHNQIKNYHFFSYAVNEALHLSPSEKNK